MLIVVYISVFDLALSQERSGLLIESLREVVEFRVVKEYHTSIIQIGLFYISFFFHFLEYHNSLKQSSKVLKRILMTNVLVYLYSLLMRL